MINYQKRKGLCATLSWDRVIKTNREKQIETKKTN